MESLKTKSITKVGAGDGFSVFASDNGIVMTCGDGTLGCLGRYYLCYHTTMYDFHDSTDTLKLF